MAFYVRQGFIENTRVVHERLCKTTSVLNNAWPSGSQNEKEEKILPGSQTVAPPL